MGLQQTISGLDTHYIHTHGPKGTVLFLHGWGAHIGLYQSIFDHLGALGYGVAAFDMPGVGGTPEPQAPMTLADYVAFTRAFCAALGLDEVLLMGHSHGGRIALSLLGEPDGLPHCKKAVLLDAAGAPSPKSLRQRLSARLYRIGRFLGTCRVTEPLFGAWYRDLRERRASADYRAASPMMRETMKLVLPCDLRPLMPSIRAEVLLVWGAQDTATPLSQGQEMAARIPNSGLAVIQNAGHFCFVDNWAQFSAVLDAFL